MRRLAIVRCALAALLFGAAAPATSRLAGDMPTFALAGLLYVGAGLVVLPAVWCHPPARVAVCREWRRAATAVIAGGAVAPVLLVAGLARTTAASASLLLNVELVATVVVAALAFREHLGGRFLTSAGLIVVAGALLTWQAGAGVDTGALLVVGACSCWGVDNAVTARIEQLAPQHVVLLKGAIAGGANLVIALIVSGLGAATTPVDMAAAVAIGAAGYGVSITLWIKGARDLGGARAQAIFSTAPFVGAALAWTLLGEPVGAVQIVATLLAAGGVVMSLQSDHEHAHAHRAIEHEHEHTHDDEGHHEHHDDPLAGRHSHRHEHSTFVHSHGHVPDLHHGHDH